MGDIVFAGATIFVSILRANYIVLPIIVQQKVVFKTRLIYQ